MAGAALLLCLVLYRRYIFLGIDFVSDGILSDTVRILYPSYVWLYDTLFSGDFSFFSLQMGIGTSLFSHGDIVFNPFTYILFLFGREHIGDMFAVLMVVEVVAASLAFYVYSGAFKIDVHSRFLGSIAYGFCGWSIIMGANLPWATMMVYLPLMLWGVEHLLRSGGMARLMVVSFLLALYGYYFYYMIALGVAAYALVRLRMLRLPFLRFLAKGIVAMVLPLAWGAFWLLPNIELVRSSPRIGGEAVDVGRLASFDLESVARYLGRMFCVDFYGAALAYPGDYFQLSSYIGLAPLLLVPQYCKFEPKRRRFVLLCLGAALLAVGVPATSFAFNGFSDFTFRWCLHLSCLGCLLFAFACSGTIAKGRFDGTLAAATIAALCVLGLVVAVAVPAQDASVLSSRLLSLAAALCILCVMAVALWALICRRGEGSHRARRFAFAAWKPVSLLALVFVCEVVWNYGPWLNDQPSAYTDMEDHGTGYFDESSRMIREVLQRDPGAYRIEKGFESVEVLHAPTGELYGSDNDSMVQGYYGLRCYNSVNQPMYIEFLQRAGVWVDFPLAARPEDGDAEPSTLNYVNGVGDRYRLMSYLGVRYYVTRDADEVEPPGYFEEVESRDGLRVYRNTVAYPLAMQASSYVPLGDYLALDDDGKDEVLLYSSVLCDDAARRYDIAGFDASSSGEEDLVASAEQQAQSTQVDLFNQGTYRIEANNDSADNRVLKVSVPWEEGSWRVFLDGADAECFEVDGGMLGTILPSGDHVIDVSYEPRGLREGIALSVASGGCTAAVAAGCAALRRFRKAR